MDLDGGMDASVDEICAVTPADPAYREGASLFVWDDAGRVGFPRMGVEAVGATWDRARKVLFYVGFADGRVLAAARDETPHPVADAEGRPRVLGAGPLRLECIHPFRQWRLRFNGTVDDGGSAIPLLLEIDARMAAPPWVLGTRGATGEWVRGEHRYEQLFDARGVLTVDGTSTTFDGGGLRIHRTGGDRGDYGDFFGHCWQSGRFASGRAFGFIHYRPRPDGSVKFREAWVLDGGGIVPAEVVDTPWMTGARVAGEDVSFTLRTPGGDVRIGAETNVSWFRPERPVREGVTFPMLQSGITRCRWDGEEGFGMIERSLIR